MTPDSLARHSARMASICMGLALGLLALNAACWYIPTLQQGFSILLTQRVGHLLAQLNHAPWWQLLGGALISSVPLLILTRGLLALRALFQIYASKSYFSVQAAAHLAQVGRAAWQWVIADFVCYPLLTVWLTMLNAPGQRMVAVTIDLPLVIGLLFAATLCVIAHILRQASELAAENQQFV